MRAAIISASGVVENIIVADAAVDQIEGFTLVNIDDGADVQPGDIYNAPNFEMGPERAALAAAALALIEAEALETE